MRTSDRLDDHAWRIKNLEARIEHLQKRLVELGVFKETEPPPTVVELSDYAVARVANKVVEMLGRASP